MEQTIDMGRKATTQTYCGPAEGHYSRKKWCGSLMILIGLLWLSACLGWFDAALFGPVLLMLIGTWIILPPLLRSLKRGEDQARNS